MRDENISKKGRRFCPRVNVGVWRFRRAFRQYALKASAVELPDTTKGDENWSALKRVYEKPSRRELGNGRLGIMVYGYVENDVYTLNDKDFWSGDPQNRDDYSGYNKDAGIEPTDKDGGLYPEQRQAAFKKAQQLLKEAYKEGIDQETRQRLIEEADKTAYGMKVSTRAMASVLPCGEMRLSTPSHKDYTDYSYTLDMDGATITTQYKVGNTTYTRQAFTSYPDDVLVVRMKSDDGTPIPMDVTMALPEQQLGNVYEDTGEPVADNQVTVDALRNEVVMTGRAPYYLSQKEKIQYYHSQRGIVFDARVKVITPDNQGITCNEDSITVNSNEILLIYSSKTNYKDPFTDPNKSGIAPHEEVKAIIDKAAKKSYETLLAAHQEDFRSEFRKLWVELDGEPIGEATPPPEKFAMKYQEARYLMLSGSREGNSDKPLNMCGIWAAWWNSNDNGAYFLNEHTQKRFSICEAANLSQSVLPLVQWLRNVSVLGQRTSEEDFGIENGWAVGHWSDAWGATVLHGDGLQNGDTTGYAIWSSGGLWLMNDLYDYYSFTQDIDYLAENYDILEGAVTFALGNLMEVEGVNGELKEYLSIVGPSTSPENEYLLDNGTRIGIDINTASDIEIYNNLFNIILEASQELKNAGKSELVDDALVNRVADAKARLVPLEMLIDEETGALKEYYNEYTPYDPHFGHNSHLLGIAPLHYTGISKRNTPEVFEAAQKAWIARGGGMAGHLPDTASQGVRLDMPSEGIEKIITCGYTSNMASFAEALLDSRNGELDILAHLPKEWTSGRISGIRARGNYELSFEWKDGELVSCQIDSKSGTTPIVRYKDSLIQLNQDERFTLVKSEISKADLLVEAKEKLDSGIYTSESAKALEEAIKSDDAGRIEQAIADLIPIAPKFTKIEDGATYTYQAGTDVNLNISATTEYTAGDAQSSVAYQIDGLGDRGKVIEKEDGVYLSWCPSNANAGQNTVIISADDGNNRSYAEITFIIESNENTADITALKTVLDEIETLDLSLYTEQSSIVCREMTDKAIALLYDANASQEQIDMMTSILSAVKDKLHLLSEYPLITVTNKDSGYQEKNGSWADSSIVGYDGIKSRYSSGSGAQATWSSDITKSGDYEVYLWRVPDAAHGAQKVQLELNHANGTWTDIQDWRDTTSGWVKLGEFEFTAGENATLTATNISGNYLRTSAVKLIRKEPSITAQIVEEIAASFIEIATPAKGEEKLTLPTVPEGFTVSIKSSSNLSVIALDGSITPPMRDTEVKLVLTVAKGTDTADTKEITVTVPGLGIWRVLLGETIKAAEEAQKQYPEHLIEEVREKFEAALKAAKEVYNDLDATDEQLMAADDELIRMMQYLSFTADKSGLEAAIKHAEEVINSDKYLDDENMAAYKAALNDAKALLNEAATDTEYNAAVKALEEAEAKLVEAPAVTLDLKALERVIEMAQEIDLSKYLDLPANKVFTDALAKAEDIYTKAKAGDKAITQEMVNEAVFELHAAMADLRKIPNKNELKDLLNQANAKDLTKYTKESSAVLLMAIDLAQAVYDDPMATQEQVEAAEELLDEAMKSLVPIQNSGDTENPDDGKDGTDTPTGDVSVLYYAILFMLLCSSGIVILHLNRLGRHKN